MPHFVNNDNGEETLVTNPNHASAFTTITRAYSTDPNAINGGKPNWRLRDDDKKEFEEWAKEQQSRGRAMYDERGNLRPSAIEEFTEAKAPQELKEQQKRQEESEAKAREEKMKKLAYETEQEAKIRAEAEFRARAEVEKAHADEQARKDAGEKRIDKKIETAIDKTNKQERS